jgi:hypothetical protein
MSIRQIARELYRLKRQTVMLEQELSAAVGEERPEIQERLRRKKAELKRVQDMLEGSKEPPAYRRPR